MAIQNNDNADEDNHNSNDLAYFIEPLPASPFVEKLNLIFFPEKNRWFYNPMLNAKKGLSPKSASAATASRGDKGRLPFQNAQIVVFSPWPLSAL